MSNNIDANSNNADWVKKTWDLPTTIDELQTPFMDDRQFRIYIAKLMSLPIGRAMPESLIDELREKFGPHFVPRYLDPRQKPKFKASLAKPNASPDVSNFNSNDLLPLGPEDFKDFEDFVRDVYDDTDELTPIRRPVPVVRDLIANALASGNYYRYVFLHKGQYRTQAFKAISVRLADDEYWELLSEIWLASDNVWQNMDDWKVLLTSRRSHREAMMDVGEQAFLSNLKYTVTIYRGCKKDLNESGLSWTLDRSVAETHADHFGEGGIVLQRKINKPEIVAYLNSREESEIINRPFRKLRKKHY
jgi:hypothetical protein